MKDTHRRLVVVAIEASHVYCSNDCAHMDHTPIAGQRCHLFNALLHWDASRKEHGNYRLEQCQRMEMPVPP